ncbi:DegT/DnrJ/EryC1/StrS family aminotransferase [Chloroflexota bacterium]
MSSSDKLIEQIRELVEKHFSQWTSDEFQAGVSKIPLMIPSYGSKEIVETIDSLLSGQVTMGEKVNQFELLFAEYIGTKHAIMVHSGSSANLLALSILTNPAFENSIKPGSEIITPAVTWATTVWPIINCNAIPVLVDVDLDTFNLNVDEVEKAITENTKAIMLVHLLGNPCYMDKMREIARKHNLYVIEDSCEAHGAEVEKQRVGSFGDIATFSFYFSHHISTIEGGMLVTDNEEIAQLARTLRVFGWVRDLKDKNKIAEENKGLDPKFLFTNLGYNLRPTEIQGAFGIHQIKELDRFIELRRENASFWADALVGHDKYLLLHKERENTRHVWFGFPVTVKPGAPFSRESLVNWLEQKGLETRSIMAGNIDEQPAMKYVDYRKVGDLPNARFITRNSFFFGNHHGIGNVERNAIRDYFSEFLDGVA